jgi:hypothetical protein
MDGEDQRVDLAADGTLRLYRNLCLDRPPPGSGLKKNALVATACDGSAEQAWVVESASSGRLTNGNKGCVAVEKNGQANGALLVVRGRAQCNGRSQGRWFALIAQGLEVEQCFGGAGSACARATNLPKAVTGRRSNKGTQKMVVSVGTIAHDNCCRQRPTGYHCQGPATGENETRCKSEWLQAERDLRRGHVWKHIFGPYTADSYTDDLAPVSGRRLVLPADDTEDSCDDSEVMASPSETRATLALAAPNGTKLDCTAAQFCASGNARSPAGKDYIVCTKP